MIGAEAYIILSACWGVIAVILLLYSWTCARGGNHILHRQLMVFLTIAALIFIAGYFLTEYVFATEPMSIPDKLIPWVALHGTLALVPLVAGPVILWSRLYELQGDGLIGRFHRHLNDRHRIYGQILVCFWIFTHLGGIANLVLLG